MVGWLPKANSHTVRALKARPVDILSIDKASMLTLPPLAPPIGLRFRIRLPRDYYVRAFACDYSFHQPRTVAIKAAVVLRDLAVDDAAFGVYRLHQDKREYAHLARQSGAEAEILTRIPAGRWGEPQDMIGPLLFLCSPASDYLHGVILPVDGGWLSR